MNIPSGKRSGVVDQGSGSGKTPGNAVGPARDASGEADGHDGSDARGPQSAPPRLPARASKNEWDHRSSRD